MLEQETECVCCPASAECHPVVASIQRADERCWFKNLPFCNFSQGVLKTKSLLCFLYFIPWALPQGFDSDRIRFEDHKLVFQLREAFEGYFVASNLNLMFDC